MQHKTNIFIFFIDTMLRNITRKLTIRLITLIVIQLINDIKLIDMAILENKIIISKDYSLRIFNLNDKFLTCINYTKFFFEKVFMLKIHGSL